MLFLTAESHQQQWLSLQQFKIRLQHLASQSILAPPIERDQLVSDWLEWLYQSSIDALFGGWYEPVADSSSHCKINCFTNTLLVEALLVCDKVALQGQLKYFGLNMLSNIGQHLFDSSSGVLCVERHYSLERLPFKLTKTKLSQILDTDELMLLLYLIGEYDSEDTGELELYYRLSLREASNRAGFHLKQAQILESTLRTKLCNHQASYYQEYASASESEDELAVKAQYLCALTQAQLWHQYEDAEPISNRLFEQLLSQLQQHNSGIIQLSHHIIVDLCYAILEHNQTCFSSESIASVSLALEQLLLIPGSNRIDWFEKLVHCAQITSDLLGEENTTVNNWLKSPMAINSILIIPALNIVKLNSESSSAVAKQNLLIQYDPRIRIYTV